MRLIEPKGQELGATIEGLDLSRPLGNQDLGQIVLALGRRGLVRFPGQNLTQAELKALSEQFGEVQVSLQPPDGVTVDVPGVGTLSNIVVDGHPIGKDDAGTLWHTEASYAKVMGYVNVLHAIKVPVRDGAVLGDTEFVDTRAAYVGLPQEIKDRLKDATATHEGQKYGDQLRAAGSKRPKYNEATAKRKVPVTHPVFLRHPITGEMALYVNPGFTMRIDDVSERESEEILAFLFEHLMKPDYRHRYRWAEGDVLIWDNLRTMHKAVLDYRPDEPRWIIRCQVMSSKIFDPAFLKN
jgi:taurine dioxygenase